MKKTVCIILVLIMLTLSAISYSVSAAQDAWVFSDSRGIYSVGVSGKSVSIASFGTYDITADIRLEYDADSVCAADNSVVMFCNDPLNGQLVVSIYYISSDELDSFAINRRLMYSDSFCCCDRDNIYVSTENKIEQYSYGGAYKRAFTLPDYVIGIVSGYEDGVFAVSADQQLFYINGDSMTAVSGTAAVSPIDPVCDDIILNGNGKILTISGDSVTNTAQSDARADSGQACVIGSILYCPSGNVIYGYDIDSGERLCSYDCGQTVRFLYADGDTVYALGNGLNIIDSPDTDSFIYPKSPDEDKGSGSNNNDSGGNNSSGSGSGNSGNQITDGMPIISSSVYNVSYNDYMISRIPAGTTIGQFKSNMKYGDCSVKVYRNESLKKSGNIGTSMTADFIKGNDVLRFELSVIGDLTGEGSANSRDLNILLDWFIGSADFSGAYELSADVNGDGKVDILDAAKLKRMY